MDVSFVSHFNYWVVVVLMMIGLYIVFASGNMVKRLVGLSVFQTSVFLLYITLGKVAGGIPPILPEHHGAHGDDADHGGHAASVAHAPAAHDLADHDAAAHAEPEAAEIITPPPLRGGAEPAAPPTVGEAVAAPAAPVPPPPEPAAVVEAVPAHAPAGHGDGLHFSADALDQLYSNPLPHVLILTAIVVGVATLAVGLALVVRIREAYGTIEDEDVSRAEYDVEVAGGDA